MVYSSCVNIKESYKSTLQRLANLLEIIHRSVLLFSIVFGALHFQNKLCVLLYLLNDQFELTV